MSSPVISVSRERIIEQLKRHYANDELTEAEFESRLKEAYAARTVPDLENIAADLPAPVAPRAEMRIGATLSGQERQLAGIVPHEITVPASRPSTCARSWGTWRFICPWACASRVTGMRCSAISR